MVPPAVGRRDQSSGTATGLALAGAAITTMANFAIAVLLARSGAELAGRFFATTAIISILGNTAALGTATGLVYFLPAARGGSTPNPRSVVAQALGPVLLAGTAAGAVIFFGARPLASLIAAERQTEMAAAIGVLAAVIPAWAVTISLLAATRGLGSMTPTVTINQMFKPAAQLVAITALLATTDEPTTAALTLAWGAPVVAAAALSFGALRRLGGLVGSGSGPVTTAEFWRYTRPRAASTGFQIALERIDVILVAALAGEAAAGIYGTITRYLTAGNFLIHSIGQATAPGLRRALAAGRSAEAKRLLRRVTGWMVLLTWPYFLVVALKADLLVALLNPTFEEGAAVLTIVGLALLANAFAGPVDLTLLMLGRSRTSLVITASALVVDVLLAIALIPRFGLRGAAIAWAAAVLVQNGAATVVVRRVGGLTGPGREAGLAGVGALMAVVPAALLTSAGELTVAVELVATLAGAGLVLIIWVFRFGQPLGLPSPGPFGSALSRRRTAERDQPAANRAMTAVSASAEAVDES